MKIVHVVNEAGFSRLPLAIEARRRGFDVIVACGAETGEARLSAAGIAVFSIEDMVRHAFLVYERLLAT